jgi:nitrous oxidase accessory protein NosD
MKRRNILLIAALSVIFLFGTISACAAVTTRYVDDDDATCGGNSPCYATIQAAVDAAGPGDTIHVAAGTYNENVDIPSGREGLRLLGHSKADTIIEADSGQVITTNSPVIIQGFHIRPAPPSATRGIRLKFTAASGTEDNPGIIRDNKIEGFCEWGIGFGSGQNIAWWEILDNEFCDCYRGLYTEDASHITISRNTFSHVDYGCVGLTGCDIVISWNTFSGSDMNEAIGFCAEKPTELIIRHNTITGYNYGIKVYDCDCGGVDPSVQVHCNNIVDNNIYGIQNLDNEANLDATNNWWGDPSGPSHSPGSGDNVSANVDFEPWLPSPFEQCPECVGVEAPAFSTLGVFSLIGLLSVVLAVAIWRKRE